MRQQSNNALSGKLLNKLTDIHISYSGEESDALNVNFHGPLPTVDCKK